MRILRAFGRSLLVVVVPIVIGILGNIIAPELTARLEAAFPNYFRWALVFLVALAIIAFISGVRDEVQHPAGPYTANTSIQVSQSGKQIGPDARVTGLQTDGDVPSSVIEQEFDKVEGELTGLKVSNKESKK